ncbi:MAG: NTP transferase domain-containing protein, partial [Victivallales bacterium]|nr:NTP transferase domain-containing protein [Victivallales bacterium]
MDKKSIAAVILCAGKGTRMNDDSKNKVCFDCAGIPVIRRIIANMRQGGVDKFVIVVGHQAQTVMDCLAGEKGVVFAYQKEQRGTGHAARCGLDALADLGFTGRSLVAMGDKIVAPEVIAGLIAKSETAEAVWGVQPVEANPSGGRVVVRLNKPYGVVEWADVAYQSLAGHAPGKWADLLSSLGLNAKKSAKVLERATRIAPAGKVTLCGRDFTATELRAVPYANAGLYCFDVQAALAALDNCQADNAQGEIYLTDTLEQFAAKGKVKLLEIQRAEDMLTFSTKVELRDMSRFFLRSASEYLEDIKSGAWASRLQQIYGDSSAGQAERYASLLEFFLSRNGDRKVLLTRSPGRVNLMGRHIDHRGGCTNVMTIDRDTVMVVS